MTGFIKLHRKLLEWEWWEDHNTTRLFLYCLMKANYQDQNWRGILIKRGSFITGLDAMATGCGIPRQSVRTSIKRLKSTGELTRQVTNKYSLVTVENYEDYQYKSDGLTPQLTPQLTLNQQSTNKQLTATKKDNNTKKVKKEESIPPIVPQWLVKKDWEDYLEMRATMKPKMTERAKELAIGKLDKFRKAGHDPAEILQNSTMGGWKGLFEPRKGKRNDDKLQDDAHDLLEQIRSGKYN